MPTVELTSEQWVQVNNILMEVPWKISNPILYEIARQLRAQTEIAPVPPPEVLQSDGFGKRKREA